jgi:hypothetical protein
MAKKVKVDLVGEGLRRLIASKEAKPKPYALTARNRERAEAAEKGLIAYSNVKGEGGRADGDTIRDMIQDIMHWAAQNAREAYIDEGVDAARDEVSRLCHCAWEDFPNEAQTDSEDE